MCVVGGGCSLTNEMTAFKKTYSKGPRHWKGVIL